MKNLFQFLTEAGASQASAQASKLNLKSDGHGSWLDSRGNMVATTENGRLKFIKKTVKPKAEGPVQQMAKRRADDDLAGAPLQRKPAPKPKEKAKEEPTQKTSNGKTITLAFGRFNPPHKGHEQLIKTAEKTAAGGDLKIYPSRTQDSEKNPIDPDMKVSYMKKMFPKYKDNIVNDPDMRTIFDVLGANTAEYDFVNIVAGPERIREFEKILVDYNGVDKNGVTYFDFKDGYNAIVAGPRDDAASGVEGASASKQRKAVVDDDFETFKSNIPAGIDDGEIQALFTATRQGMNAKVNKDIKKKLLKKEEVDLWQIAPRLDQQTLREQYVTKKIFNIGDLVESLNTGLIGRIIRRGTNYLICVTENNNMFKSWIRDVMETVKPAIQTGVYGVPANQREVGTDSFRKYAQSMVPGQEKIRNFINKYKAKK